jgi:hypothetical protein
MPPILQGSTLLHGPIFKISRKTAASRGVNSAEKSSGEHGHNWSESRLGQRVL